MVDLSARTQTRSVLTLSAARGLIASLAAANAPIEVPLVEALGLILAEPVSADVDQPTCAAAACAGYAVRSGTTVPGTSLHVVDEVPGEPADFGAGDHNYSPEIELGPDETVSVERGGCLPLGTDAILGENDFIVCEGSEAGFGEVGRPRLIRVGREVTSGWNVTPRGFHLRAGDEVARAGSRVQLSMMGLLASQGAVHPLCRKRARVAVLAVGDDLVGPGEAPILDRRRNASGTAVVTACLARGATAHDLGVVATSEVDAAFSRALAASVVVILGPAREDFEEALERLGVEPMITGLAFEPGGGQVRYGVVRDESGIATNHVFQASDAPIAATALATLVIGPLIDRLHGAGSGVVEIVLASLTSPPPATGEVDCAWPARLEVALDGRLCANPIASRGCDDLAAFAAADAWILLPAGSGPWEAGDVVAVESMLPGRVAS